MCKLQRGGSLINKACIVLSGRFLSSSLSVHPPPAFHPIPRSLVDMVATSGLGNPWGFGGVEPAESKVLGKERPRQARTPESPLSKAALISGDQSSFPEVSRPLLEFGNPACRDRCENQVGVPLPSPAIFAFQLSTESGATATWKRPT